MTWLKQKNDKLKKLQKDKVVVVNKIDTLRKMRKDFPASDDVNLMGS